MLWLLKQAIVSPSPIAILKIPDGCVVVDYYMVIAYASL